MNARLRNAMLEFGEAANAAIISDEGAGLYEFYVHISALVATVTGEIREETLSDVLKSIGSFNDGEIDPDPALTAAMVHYFALEAKHGREEIAKEGGPQ